MFKQKPKNTVTVKRALVLVLPVLFVVMGVIAGWPTQQVVAATSNTVNFQARLLTAAGNVVPDGYYNVEFKLYKTDAKDGGETTVQGSCVTNPGGVADEDCLWTETRINADKVRVANGYLTVNLGSVTAFPGGMPWDQQMWLTMNIGGTGSPSWDGEMNPRLKLTATPYAMSTGKVVSSDGTGSATVANGESGTICVQNSLNCGFISLQGSTPGIAQTGNFNISGTGIANALQASSFDTSAAGALTVGGANATSIVLAQNVTVATGKTLTLAGGTTAGRPVAPAEGTLYFDTTTKQLVVYANGKWQGDRSSSTKIVAMGSTSGCTGSVPTASQNADAADYVVTSCTSAQTMINSAIASLPSGGGTVYLMEGTYIVDGIISVPNNVTISGAGAATIIKLKNGINTNINIIENSDTDNGTNITIRDIKFDGNKANNSSGNQNATYFRDMGAVTGLPGVKIEKIWVENFRGGIGFSQSDPSSNSSITDSVFIGNTTNPAIYAEAITKLTISRNIFQSNNAWATVRFNESSVVSNNQFVGNTGSGVYTQGSYNTVAGNYFESTVGAAIDLVGVNADSNTVSNNVIRDGTAIGIFVKGNKNTVTSNTLINNAGDGIGIENGDNNTISDNQVTNSGGSGTGSGIRLYSTDSYDNIIAGNAITDTVGTGYAIQIIAERTYVSNNLFSGTGAASIGDSGVGTIYSNQQGGNNDIIIKGSAGLGINTTTTTASLTLQGGLRTTTLPSPAAPTVLEIGSGAGTATYTYAVSANDGLGETLISATTQVTSSPTTLNGTNFNRISWGRVPGAISYKVYRTAVGGTGSTHTAGLIGTVSASSLTMQFDDTGFSTSGSVPTANSTGGAYFAGAITAAKGFDMLYSAGNNFTIQGASSTFVSVDPENSKFYVGSQGECGGRFCVAQVVSTGGGGYTNTTNVIRGTAAVTTNSNFINQDVIIDDDTLVLSGTRNNNRGVRIDFSGSSNSYSNYYGLHVKLPSNTDSNLYRGSAILVENGTAEVFKVSNLGAVTSQATANSTNAFQVMDSAGNSRVNVDTTNNLINLLGNNTGHLGAINQTTNVTVRYNASSVVLNGYIYLFGGANASGTATNTVQYAKLNADGTAGAWSTTTNLPASFTATSAVAYKGSIYVAGANNSTIYGAIPTSTGTITSWVTAKTNAALNTASIRLVATHDYVYALANGTDDAQAMYANWWDATLGDPIVQTNIFGGTVRSDSAVVASGDYIYVLGSQADATVYSIQVYGDGRLDTAENMGTMPAVRGWSNAAIMNGYIYVYGGKSTSAASNSSNSVYYAPIYQWGVVGAWTLDTTTLPDARSGAAVTQYNGYMYIIGGANGSAGAYNNTWYTSASRVQVGGSLDLTAYTVSGSGEGIRGSITAGRGTFYDGLEVVRGITTDGLRVEGVSDFMSDTTFYNDVDIEGGGWLHLEDGNGKVVFIADGSQDQVVLGFGTRLLFNDDNCGSYKCLSIAEDGADVGTDSDIMRFHAYEGYKFSFGTNAYVALRMDDQGRVAVGIGSESLSSTSAFAVVGDTSTFNAAKTKQFRIRTSGSAVDIEAGSTTDGAQSLVFGTWSDVDMTTGQKTHLRFDHSTSGMFLPSITAISGSNNLLCISSGKSVRIGTTTCNASSARYKHNITSVTEQMGLDTLMALRPVTYNYNDTGVAAIGLIAEEVADVLPLVVEYDEQGRPNGVNYEYMVANLIKGIQQQQVQINDIRNSMWSGGLITRDAVFNGYITFNSGVRFKSDVNFDGKTIFNGSVAFNENTTGNVVIPEGETEVEVVFAQPYEQEIPNISVSSSDFVQLKLKDKTVNGFKIVISSALDHDITVDWIALQKRQVSQAP